MIDDIKKDLTVFILTCLLIIGELVVHSTVLVLIMKFLDWILDNQTSSTLLEHYIVSFVVIFFFAGLKSLYYKNRKIVG